LPESKQFPYSKLLNWFKKQARPLPWREQYNPYEVAISEYMLQQTQIVTVLPYFDKWTKRWPNWKSLSKANEEDVVSMWSGLGYYSRARRLLVLAQKVVSDYNGHLPSEKEELLKLPGIGDYTASAIASIAFNKASFPVDGNVRRVLSRFYENKMSSPSVDQDDVFKKEVDPVFEKTKKRRELAQALMELGALVCTPKANCVQCPLNKECLGYKHDSFASLPLKKKKVKAENIFINYCWVYDDKGNTLVKQRPNKGRFSGFFEPPLIEHADNTTGHKKLMNLIGKEEIKFLKSSISHFTKYKAKWSSHEIYLEKKKSIKGYKWVKVDKLQQLNLIPKIKEGLS